MASRGWERSRRETRHCREWKVSVFAWSNSKDPRRMLLHTLPEEEERHATLRSGKQVTAQRRHGRLAFSVGRKPQPRRRLQPRRVAREDGFQGMGTVEKRNSALQRVKVSVFAWSNSKDPRRMLLHTLPE